MPPGGGGGVAGHPLGICGDRVLSHADGGFTHIAAAGEQLLAELEVRIAAAWVWVVCQHDYSALERDAIVTYRVRRNDELLRFPIRGSVAGYGALLPVCVKPGDRVRVTGQVLDANLLTTTPIWLRGALFVTDDPFWSPPIRPAAATVGRWKTASVLAVAPVPTPFAADRTFVASGDGLGVYLQASGGGVRIHGRTTSGAGLADAAGITLGDGEETLIPIDDLRRLSYAAVLLPATIR
jgi:hypothetical protein